MRDYIIFGNGWIGNILKNKFKCILISNKINSYSDICYVMNFHAKPKVIINCIGEIGKNNADDCEKDIDGTISSNSFVPLLLAEYCFRNNIKLIHISSGCLYHYDYKEDPIDETKTPDFYDLFYCRTKIYSELALLELSKRSNVLIVRPRIPIDIASNRRNLLDKLIRYKRAIDINNSITYIPEFIEALRHLIDIDATGIYNLVCKDGFRYPEILEEYKKIDPSFEYEVTSLEKLNIVRTNIILSSKKLESTGFKLKDKKEILTEIMKGRDERYYNNNANSQ